MFGSTNSVKKIVEGKRKGILRTVEGDATTPQTTHEKEIVIIPHVCNDEKIWGGGCVIALSKKWPEPEKMYRAFCDGVSPYPERNKNNPILGKNCSVKIDNHLTVMNMIAQDSIISKDNPKPIKYKALANAMEDVFGYVEMIKCQTSSPVVIHCPKFGSLRSGGNWEFILELIREIWLEQGIDVVVYEFVE